MRTTAKVDVLAGMLQRDRHAQRFFTQAGWAYNHISRFLEVLLGLSGEQVSACLATEMVFFTFVAVSGGLIVADS
jgi:hypothetical protein